MAPYHCILREDHKKMTSVGLLTPVACPFVDTNFDCNFLVFHIFLVLAPWHIANSCFPVLANQGINLHESFV